MILDIRILKGVSIAAALSLFAGAAAAQQTLGRTSAEEVEARFDRASQLSGPEKEEEADRYLEAMKSILKAGFTSLGEARDDKDLVKMTCVNEKLTSEKGLLKISEQAYVQLQEAVARGDTDASNHEFTKIAIAFQKMRGLGVEVEGCAGEALRYTGKTKVDVEVAKEITDDDPTTQSESDPILDEHPAATSPFQ